MQNRSPHRQPSVAADHISAVVGDVDRPVRHYPFSRDLGHLPGPSSVASGVGLLLGMVRHGEAFFSSQKQRYGSVFKHMVFTDPIVCVADAELNAQIGQNKEGVWSSALPWAYLLGGVNRQSATVDGALAVDGPFHHDARQIMRPAFSAAALDGYVAEATRMFIERFASWQARGRVPFKAEVRRLLAEVSAHVFLGISDPAQGALLDRATEHTWLAPQTFFKRSSWSLSWRRAMGGYDTLWNALRPQVQARREGDGTDLFSRMCQTETTGTWLHDDDALVRTLISTMMAAFDTTSSGIASMAYLLGKNPEWQERLCEESASVSVAGTTPNSETLKKLPQHDWVWKETLRCMPVAGQLNRQTLRETTLGGHRIPAGAYVAALTGSAMWDERYWTEPERFDPTRFSPERAEHKRNPAAYLPFGAGNHVCLGAQLASLEALAFYAALLSRYRIRLAPDYQARHGYLPFGIVSGRLDITLDAR